MDRARRKVEADKAYDAQVKAGTEGALTFSGIGTGLAVVAHYTWPSFRRQTLAFKGFLVSSFAIFGLVYYAENALQVLEAEQRRAESAIRSTARLELHRQGIVPTETAIAQWREAKLKEIAQEDSRLSSA